MIAEGCCCEQRLTDNAQITPRGDVYSLVKHSPTKLISRGMCDGSHDNVSSIPLPSSLSKSIPSMIITKCFEDGESNLADLSLKRNLNSSNQCMCYFAMLDNNVGRAAEHLEMSVAESVVCQ